ncbi:MAG TPA: MFS transporter [Gaiellaceae bacterium]
MGTLREHLVGATAALRGVFGNTGLRRITLAYGGSALGLYAGSVVVAVYCYHHGGATAVGVVLFARLSVSAAVAPFAASLADRYRQERVMVAADLSRVATVAATAAAAAAGSSALVYVLATLTSVVGTIFRPAEASLIPTLARSPEELTAANVASSTFDSVGAFAGPALGALVLAVGGTTAGFALVAALYLWSASFVARIPPTEHRAAEESEREDTGLAAGFRAVRNEPRLQLLIGLYSAQTLVAGAYNVLVVVVALQLLSLGNAGVGYLETATGVGALVGAGVTLALVARRRPGSDLSLGLFLFGAPFVLIAALPHTWAALVGLAILGVGNSIVDIAAVTLLQRTAPPAVAGRVFGLLESAVIGALGIGALATPFVVHVAGSRGALLAAGVVLPALVLLTRRALAHVDAAARVPTEQLEAIASVPFLAPLPLQRQEALAAALERVELAAGATLFTRGDRGDRFYIVAAGAVAIDLETGTKIETAPAFVGEIAVLAGVPRTATVRAESAVTLWALDAHRFVAAVTGHDRTRTAAETVVVSRGAVLSV